MEKIQLTAQFLILEIEKEFDIKVKKIEIEQNETSIIMAIDKKEEEK